MPYAKLLFGILSIALSGLWLAQIIVYQLFTPPVRHG